MNSCSLTFLLAIIKAKTGSWVSTDEIILCVLKINGYFMSFSEKGVVFISALGIGCNK